MGVFLNYKKVIFIFFKSPAHKSKILKLNKKDFKLYKYSHFIKYVTR